MEVDLTGKSALVGGSTGGIGKAIATRLAASGASVCLMARNKSKLEKVVNELDKSRNQKHGFLEVDFSNYKLFSTKIKSFFEKNQIDILVNNTQGPPAGSALEKSIEELEDQLIDSTSQSQFQSVSNKDRHKNLLLELQIFHFH